jgi:hypothetical protein
VSVFGLICICVVLRHRGWRFFDGQRYTCAALCSPWSLRRHCTLYRRPWALGWPFARSQLMYGI